MPLSVTQSSNFLGESSRGSDENIPRQTGCDVCGGGRGRILPWNAKKTEGGKEERKDRIATPLPIAARGVQAPVEAPVQSSWHTYELCIRCSLCVIARCIIIPERKFLLRFHLARDIRGTDGKMQDGARANSDGSLRWCRGIVISNREYVPRSGQPLFVFKRIVSMDGVKICGEKIVER